MFFFQSNSRIDSAVKGLHLGLARDFFLAVTSIKHEATGLLQGQSLPKSPEARRISWLKELWANGPFSAPVEYRKFLVATVSVVTGF